MLNKITSFLWNAGRVANQARIAGSLLKGNFKPLERYAVHRTAIKIVNKFLK